MTNETKENKIPIKEVRVYDRPTTKWDLIQYCQRHSFTSGTDVDFFVPAVATRYINQVTELDENNNLIRVNYIEDLWDLINHLN